MTTAAERFWSKVDKSDECWVWTRYINPAGYGYTGGRPAHRVAYELAVGPIPDGMTLDHLCRVRNCVRPDHLDPCTIDVNTKRGLSFSAVNAAKTHCKRGHLFTDANTWTPPDGRRQRLCLDCKHQRDAEYAARQQAKKAAARAAHST